MVMEPRVSEPIPTLKSASAGLATAPPSRCARPAQIVERGALDHAFFSSREHRQPSFRRIQCPNRLRKAHPQQPSTTFLAMETQRCRASFICPGKLSKIKATHRLPV